MYMHTVSAELREIKVNTFHAEGGSSPKNVWFLYKRIRSIFIKPEKCETNRESR